MPFEDRASYYNKIFKSKPFRIVGKSEFAKDVIEFSAEQKKEVRFVTEETFRTLVSVVAKPQHLLLVWLAWDIGENIDALLKLTKNDFLRQTNRYTKEPEYLVNLPKTKIKRSRQSRSEPTNHAETVRHADIVLRDLGRDDRVFPFGYRQALKVLHAAVRKTGATSMPNHEPVRWKDLRSGMACHLLKLGWTTDEVNARLGHTPRSAALDAYINFLAIDREKPKQRVFDTSLEELQHQLTEAKQQAGLAGERLERQEQQQHAMQAEIARTRVDVQEIRRMIAELRQLQAA